MKKILLVIGCLFIAFAQNAQTELWGTTQNGGKYGAGVIFKTGGSGNSQTIEHSFFQVEGSTPQLSNLIQANDGKLYGMTSLGGINNSGIIFQYDTATDTLVKKFDFDNYLQNGSSPQGSLVQASDGNLYGVTKSGGANNLGVLFQYDPSSNVFTKKYDFATGAGGNSPWGALVQASDGKLYGLALQGGISNYGVLFQFDPSTGTYTKMIDFGPIPIGCSPYGSLIQANDGYLYGINYYGGSGYGVLFQYDFVNNTISGKITFDGAVNGGKPKGSLMQASDGNLYGMTSTGGLNSKGTIFQYNPLTEGIVKKFDFDSITGSTPIGSLIQGSNGYLYGMTSLGGTNNKGVLFKYDLSINTYSLVINFDGTTTGSKPQGALFQATNGNLYGMATNEGLHSKGNLFHYNPVTNGITNIAFGDIDGIFPLGGVIKASDGNFYGVTSTGGIHDKGVLFQFDPINRIYNKLVDFDGTQKGRRPYGSLMQATDGYLYGLTLNGGVNDLGVLFQYDIITHTYLKKIDLSAINGSSPQGFLIQYTDGNLYGLTGSGGTSGGGVIFQYNPLNNIYTKKIDFIGASTGFNPIGSLLYASDGMLYGTTYSGGANNKGVIYQYNPISNILMKKYDFIAGTTGSQPRGSLAQATNGNFYGITPYGGMAPYFNYGVLYQFDPINNVYAKILDFNGTNGSQGFGDVMAASDGNVYGMTIAGGIGHLGVMFQYNPSSGIYTKKIEFDGLNGGRPVFNNIIEVAETITKLDRVTEINILKIYPNPNNGLFTIDLTSRSQITITNVLGETLFNQSMETGKQTLNIQSQTNGIYFVKITDSTGKSSTSKIIVNK